MIFVSAGHNSKSKTIKQDPGAVGVGGVKEGDLTIEFRDLVCAELDKLGRKYIKDSDEEDLRMYLKRINTGSGSVVTEYHFDAGSEKATGCTAIIEEEADDKDHLFARAMVESTSKTLGLRNRGVISEAESHRGRLGLMREDGIVCLVELAFVTNAGDLEAYQKGKLQLAREHAELLGKYDDLLK